MLNPFGFLKKKSAPILKDALVHPSKNTSPPATKKDSSQPSTSFGAGINSGGYKNSMSGAGGGFDKNMGSTFSPTILENVTFWQTLLNESWAAKKFVNFPIDQLLMRPRVFDSENDFEIEKYESWLKQWGSNEKLGDTMKGGRLYGTSFLIFITKEAPLDEPLDLRLLRKGDLVNVLVFDRFSTFVLERTYDFTNPNYGRAIKYKVSPKFGGGFEIHHSRVLRMDGQVPLSSNGWVSGYSADYGVPELIPVMEPIYQQAQAAHATSQLMSEASIPVIKMQGFREAVGACPGISTPADGASVQTYADNTNMTKSVYNQMIMDAEDEYERVAVNFSGLPELLDRYAAQLAAAADIPATIFLGKSPVGLNATGENDLIINAGKVAAQQENRLRPAYEFIDAIMTRTGGFEGLPDYTFPSLLDISDTERTDIALKKVEMARDLFQTGLVSSDEARNILKGDDVIGELDEGFDFSKEIDEERRINEEAEKELEVEDTMYRG